MIPGRLVAFASLVLSGCSPADVDAPTLRSMDPAERSADVPSPGVLIRGDRLFPKARVSPAGGASLEAC
jgi:hypothetical protein